LGYLLSPLSRRNALRMLNYIYNLFFAHWKAVFLEPLELLPQVLSKAYLHYVPVSQLSRYSFCCGVRVSMVIPMLASLRRPMSWSSALGSV